MKLAWSAVLYIDKRDGSDYLCEPLKQLGLQAELVHLPFATLRLPAEVTMMHRVEVGIEFKKLDDLVTSLRRAGYKVISLPGMLGPQGAYDIGFLLVEVTGARIRLAC